MGGSALCCFAAGTHREVDEDGCTIGRTLDEPCEVAFPPSHRSPRPPPRGADSGEASGQVTGEAFGDGGLDRGDEVLLVGRRAGGAGRGPEHAPGGPSTRAVGGVVGQVGEAFEGGGAVTVGREGAQGALGLGRLQAGGRTPHSHP
jgi:hypothetical protein